MLYTFVKVCFFLKGIQKCGSILYQMNKGKSFFGTDILKARQVF